MKPRTFRAEREFGLLVGAVFSLLGLWWFYRGKFATAAYVFTITGTALVLLGAAFPGLLVIPRKLWMKLAEALAYVFSPIILAIIFFLRSNAVPVHASRSGILIRREIDVTTKGCIEEEVSRNDAKVTQRRK
jgi:hypothetical protein